MTDTDLNKKAEPRAETAGTQPQAAEADTEAKGQVEEVAEAAAEISGDQGLAEPAALEGEIARLREENETLRDQALRALAETENTRRRLERDKDDTARFAIARFAKDLLSVADNMHRALHSVPQDALADNEMLARLVEGVAATEKELLSSFEKHGLVQIDPAGEKFDPNYHEAMFEMPGTGQLPGTVVQVMAPGYVLNGRLVRPAMVAVAKGEPPQKVDTTA